MTHRQTLTCGAAIIGLLVAFAAPVAAAPVVIEATGTVGSGGGAATFGQAGGFSPVGQAFTMRVTLDSPGSATVYSPPNQNVSFTPFGSATVNITMFGVTEVWTVAGGTIELTLANGLAPPLGYAVGTTETVGLVIHGTRSFEIRWTGAADLLSSAATTQSASGTSVGASTAQVQVSASNPTGTGGVSFTSSTFTWTLNAAAEAAVPEPASLALLGMGLAGLGLAGRRRQAPAG